MGRALQQGGRRRSSKEGRSCGERMPFHVLYEPAAGVVTAQVCGGEPGAGRAKGTGTPPTEGRLCVFTTVVSQYLEKCLAHSRYSYLLPK